MFFRMIYDDTLAQAAYLIGCQKTSEAIVIDPERDIDRYIRAAEAEGLRIVAVAETHIHADFLSGCREFAERLDTMLYLSDEGDAEWKTGWLSKKSDGGRYAHRLVRDGDRFTIGHIAFTVMHTPGHTPEHVCFAVTDRGGGADAPMGLITGDFLFVGDIGRPDLLETAAGAQGAMEPAARQLAASARRVGELPDFVQIWPAHGAGSACGKALGAVPQSTVGYERRFNPALQFGSDDNRFVEWVLSGQPEPPLYFGRMKVLNRDGVPVLGSMPSPKDMSAQELQAIDGARVAVLDTRKWSDFRAGHLRGALFTPLGATFPTIAGSYVSPTEDIVLIAAAPHVDETVRCLVRIGLDRIIGFATPATLCHVAAGLATVDEIPATRVNERRHDGSLILDVRGAAEREAGFIPESTHIAHTRLLERLNELPTDKKLFVHCRSGGRSACATALLQRHGFDAVNVAGGYEAFAAADGAQQTACRVRTQ